MGRIMSFGQDGRRVRDFDKSEHDFLRRYGRTPEEVMDENAKLIVKLNAEHIVRQNVEIENAKLRELCASLFRLANNECLSNTRRCGDCPMNRDEPPCNLSLDFIAMRKLGIDVTPWEVERIEVPE